MDAVVGWILNVAYGLLIAAVSPLLVWRSVRQGKYRQGWSEKLCGRLPRMQAGEARRPIIWLHAVSVGEVLQLRTIVPRLQSERPDCQLLITTTTSTGHAVARETFADCQVAYLPLDFTWAVRTALARIRPSLIVLVELELWPNFIRQADAAGVPLVLINGRMSSRSYRGYRHIRPLMRGLLRRFAHIAVQTEEYATRLIDLGAPRECVTVTGSVKFDGLQTDRDNAKTVALRRAFGIAQHERVFIAGSTHEPEERIAIEAYLSLREEFDDLRLVLVPRHAERFEDVARLAASYGVELVRRSEVTNLKDAPAVSTHGAWPVGLLDTLGALSACWGLADVAFVGGSLTSRGGQNMIEPAGYGAAVVVGPNTHNFRDVVEGLQLTDGIRVIRQASDLTGSVRDLLRDTDAARQQGLSAREFVLTQQGATDRTIRLLTDQLPKTAVRRAA